VKVVIEERIWATVIPNSSDSFTRCEAILNQDECEYEARAVKSSLAANEYSIALLPAVVSEVDCLLEALQVDLTNDTQEKES
jgi:hypothetical protein